jgi:hypothetical protein
MAHSQENNKSKDYLKEIPFDFSYGIPIIEVSIDGKNYNFLFDTGMPTAISKKLYTELNLNSSKEKNGSDIYGNKNKESYTTLKQLNLSGINFYNTETLVANLESSFELKCLKLDGVLGNNLMKNNIWEIDYSTKTIRLTDNISLLKNLSKSTKITFKTKKGSYSPKISLKINGKTKKNILFDTGSNGGINISIEEYSNKIYKNSIEKYGSSGVALYGHAKKNKTVFAKVNNIHIGSLQIDNQLVTFSKKTALIGNQFLKNFKIILDYTNNELHFIKNKAKANSTLKSFGFNTNVINNKIIVTAIYNKSTPQKEGLSLGDEIISINGIKVSAIINSNDSCQFIKDLLKKDTISFEVKHRKKNQKFELTKKELL